MKKQNKRPERLTRVHSALYIGFMLQSRRQEINGMAEKIRAALELNAEPFDVEEAIRRLGGQLVHTHLEGADAKIMKQPDGFRIEVAHQGESRQRFSLAHELGHLFLHMGFIIDPKRWASVDEYQDSPKYRYGFSEEEYEAHEFAAALLMPAQTFRDVARRHTVDGQTDLDLVAAHFKVSTKAARVRGQWLGIFAWDK